MIPMNDNIEFEKQIEEIQHKLEEFVNLKIRLWEIQNLVREELDKMKIAFSKR